MRPSWKAFVHDGVVPRPPQGAMCATPEDAAEPVRPGTIRAPPDKEHFMTTSERFLRSPSPCFASWVSRHR